ncbi:uncharacterized protein MAM_04712 [Metarhizium album ARSEF 1941]|uniref:Uncharacterized protein n=1 Tax=Metarhizium album (strain ARSEF 1941) TaxID=1081103 RepID=A0A0B2WW86_METAS|nr:uncharacterized protein MAM_04712 [Metarhizium album ARSEF 1941]KHN97697.1 hypothetical protein MAM_04712 [Metarhizium album ARSEF 1941]
MSQVKNLRAMFENKGDASPPDRGRSPGITPGGHIGDASSNGSSRPLSKVRTNFVAIEKDGRMGLRRDHSGESSLSRRRTSVETADTESNGNYLDNPSTMPSDGVGESSRRNVASKTIFESLRILPHHEKAGVPVSGDSDVNRAHTEAENKPASPLRQANEQAGTSSAENAEFKSASVMDPSPSTKQNTRSSAQAITTTTGAMRNTSATSAARSSSNTATRSLKIRESSADEIHNVNAGPIPSAKARTVAPGAAKSRTLKTKSQNDAGFVKPKPKSPTQPVQMPSSLTAPTASSVSKVHVSRQSLFRHIGIQDKIIQPTLRSTMSNSTVPQPAIKGKGSSFSKSRPSLGPPPRKQSQLTASQKRQSNVDERFLARMMRPTQASSSKATDKVPVTPPKRTVPRLVGGEHGNQAVPRSASSRSQRIPMSTTPRRIAVPLTGYTEEFDPLNPEEEGNEFLNDHQLRIYNAHENTISSSNPATKCSTEEMDSSAAPQEPQRLETVTSLFGNVNLAMNDPIYNSRLREEADDPKASLTAVPTPPAGGLTEAPESVGSNEIAGEDKSCGAIEGLNDEILGTTTKQQMFEAESVPEKGKVHQGPIGNNRANEEPIIAEGHQTMGLVEMDLVEQHAIENSVSHLDTNHLDKQSIQ